MTRKCGRWYVNKIARSKMTYCLNLSTGDSVRYNCLALVSLLIGVFMILRQVNNKVDELSEWQARSQNEPLMTKFINDDSLSQYCETSTKLQAWGFVVHRLDGCQICLATKHLGSTGWSTLFRMTMLLILLRYLVLMARILNVWWCGMLGTSLNDRRGYSGAVWTVAYWSIRTSNVARVDPNCYSTISVSTELTEAEQDIVLALAVFVDPDCLALPQVD
jgi:hypothetical protein